MRKKKVSLFSQILVHFILICGVATMILPFFWMISTSFKPKGEIFTLPPKWIPAHPTFSNYIDLFKSLEFSRPLVNTIIVALCITFFSILIASMAGYAFAKFKFKGKEKLFMIVLGTLMVPGQITMIPVFIILRYMGLLNTYLGLILPAVVSAYNIFFMKQFISGIPDELIEAAKIDGAGENFIFFKIILPLAKPALAALAIFTFTGSWNSFLWPLIISTNETMYTLPVAISVLGGQYEVNYGVQMAGAVVVIIPLIIVFLSAQKYFVKGISLTGLKG